MKLLALFLFTFSAHATDVYVVKVTAPELDDGLVITWESNGAIHCLGLPQWIDMLRLPDTWTIMQTAAIDYSWPGMTGAAAEACLAGPRRPRTVATQLFSFDSQLRGHQIADIPIGVVCGDKIADYQLYHAVTYNGQKGIGVCW